MRQLLVERDGPIARLTLARPDRRNALSLELLREFDQALTQILAAAEARVVVIAGQGPVFSAGHDLAELDAMTAAERAALFAECSALMERIGESPIPVIARVHGLATAAGCQMVAACDLAVAADTATFATPGVKIGLFCSTPAVPIGRCIGPKRAMEMLLTGVPIDARTAAEWGLVNRVVPADRLDSALDDLVRPIVAASQATVALGKIAFRRQMDEDLHTAYESATRAMTANAQLPDAREGIRAFLEKRAPTWQRR